MSFAYHLPRNERRRYRRSLILGVAVSVTASTVLAALVLAFARPAVALDAPCGVGKAYVRMWELPGFEGDVKVLCVNTGDFGLVGNNNRVCDSPEGWTTRYTWLNCPSSLYVYGHAACFYTDTYYRGSGLRVVGPWPWQGSLTGLFNNNIESFKWC